MTSLADMTLLEASELFAARSVSATELLDATLERLAKTEPHVRAYATVNEPAARSAASAADRDLAKGRWRGGLHGIPVGVKDLAYTADTPTEGGSRALRGFVPPFDATVVRKLRDAGAVIVGKTVTHEFAYGQNIPPTRNAWNQNCYPGGSSAGSGVAVAVGSAFGAIGTDTGASIRVPASVNGVVGLKPTFGRVSRHGVMAMSFSLDHVGPLTRTVEDCALVLEAIAGHDAQDHTSLQAPAEDFRRDLDRGVMGMRLGVDRGYYFYDHVVEDVRTATLDAISELERQGAVIVDVSIPELELMAAAGFVLVLADTSDYHRRLLRSGAEYDPATKLMVQLGELVSATSYLTAQRARAAMCAAVKAAYGRHRLDALLAPTIPTTTMPVEQLSVALGADVDETALSAFLHHNIPSNLTGQPALSVPCGFSRDQLPIGLQLIGRPLDEATLFRIARAYERETRWYEQRPPVTVQERVTS